MIYLVVVKLLAEYEKDSIHFYLAVRSIVIKLTRGDVPDTVQMNSKSFSDDNRGS